MNKASRQQLKTIIEKRSPKYKHVSFEQKLDALLEHKFVLLEIVQTYSDRLTQAGVKHAVVGGHGAIFHGSPRTTSDIDFLVNANDLELAIKALGGTNPTPLNIGGYGIKVGNDDIDLISFDEPWVNGAIANSIRTRHGQMVSKPYLALMKLFSSRGGQEDMDIAHVMRGMDENDINLTRKLIAKYLPNDIEDLDCLFELAKLI